MYTVNIMLGTWNPTRPGMKLRGTWDIAGKEREWFLFQCDLGYSSRILEAGITSNKLDKRIFMDLGIIPNGSR